MVRSRPKPGQRRIDAAIDHLAQYGFAKPQIRKTISDLLQLYGRNGWVFLEEGSYGVVLEKLLEEQEQQNQKKEALAAEDAEPKNGMEVSLVHDEAPNESPSSLQQQASLNSSPPLEHVLALPRATGAARARPPCHGWISEESESESEPEPGATLSDVPRPAVSPSNPVETLPLKRKRPSRWDVHPN